MKMFSATSHPGYILVSINTETPLLPSLMNNLRINVGQISAQWAAFRVKQAKTAANKTSVDAFIEEAVVRRELSDNFCSIMNTMTVLRGHHSGHKTH